MDIQTGRQSNVIRALLNLKERAIVQGVAPEILPVFSVEDLPAELLIFNSVNIAGAVGQVTGAGANANVGLCNPAGSGVVLVVDSLLVDMTTAQDLLLTFGTDLSGTLVTATHTFLDSRAISSSSARTVGQVRTNTAAGGGVNFGQFALPVGTTDVEHARGIVIGPGFSLRASTSTITTEIVANFRWRERLLEASERRP